MDSIRQEIRALMREREALEASIAERMARLTAPGQPGMDEPLVDREGFPRADVDVHAVRVDRNAVICGTNDHKALTARIERLMHELHAAARDAKDGAADANGPAGASEQQGAAAAPPANGSTSNAAPAAAAAAPAAPAAQPLRPFAVVDDVTEGSPAAEAGVQLGDQLCRFGNVAPGAGGGDELQRVAALLSASEGRAVAAVVLRHGAPVTLSLTPRQWAGRGLLGCHLRPLGR